MSEPMTPPPSTPSTSSTSPSSAPSGPSATSAPGPATAVRVLPKTATQELGDRLRGYLHIGHGGRYAALDGFRAIAAIGVLVYHVAGYARIPETGSVTGRFLENLGNFGVAVFFLLSGFLLYRGFVGPWFRGQPAPEPMSYLRRRLLRILPAYWVALIVFLWLGLDTVKNNGPDYYFTLFTLTQVYRKALGLSGLPVAWTLCIEVSFYIALPLIAAGIRFLGRNATSLRMKLEVQLVSLATLAAISYIFRYLVAGPAAFDNRTYAYSVFHLWLLNYLDWFALGMLLAVVVCWREVGRSLPRPIDELANRGWLCWTLAAGCYAYLMFSRDPHLSTAQVHETTGGMFLRFTFNGLAALFFLLPGILGRQDGGVARALSRPWPLFLGTISYGIYLWHKVWLDWLNYNDPGGKPMTFWPMLFAVVALTFLSATASYYLIERPSLRFKQSKRARATTRDEPATVP